jgi:hypothetical protein
VFTIQIVYIGRFWLASNYLKLFFVSRNLVLVLLKSNVSFVFLTFEACYRLFLKFLKSNVFFNFLTFYTYLRVLYKVRDKFDCLLLIRITSMSRFKYKFCASAWVLSNKNVLKSVLLFFTPSTPDFWFQQLWFY